MRTILNDAVLVLVPENPEETAELERWAGARCEHIFLLQPYGGAGAVLKHLGSREVACNEPINVTSRNPEPTIRLISNFAPTPFELDGVAYASVEGFWQSLKYPKRERATIAALTGATARRAGEAMPYGPTVVYRDDTIPVGTWAHWELMKRACWAKFTQNDAARAALLSTGQRPLVHRVRHDSRAIPGAIMAEIWTEARARLAGACTPSR